MNIGAVPNNKKKPESWIYLQLSGLFLYHKMPTIVAIFGYIEFYISLWVIYHYLIKVSKIACIAFKNLRN